MKLDTPPQNGYDFELITKWFTIRVTRFGLASLISIVGMAVVGQPLC